MEQIVYTLNTSEEPLYAAFKIRVGVVYIDVLILAPLTFGLLQYNLIYIKSFMLSVVLSFVPVIYKCWMEKEYGATFGKKIMKISVVSEKLQRLSYQEVCIRNYYYFIGLITAITANYFLYALPDFQAANTFNEVWELKDMQFPHKIIRYALTLLMVIDGLLMFKSSRNQTLHDRLGKTVVIKKQL